MNRFAIATLFIVFALFTGSDIYAFLIALPVMLIASWQMANIKAPDFTSDDMLWFCLLLYFGVVPAQLFSDGYFAGGGPTSGLKFFYTDIMYAMAIVLLFILAFIASKYVVNVGEQCTGAVIDSTEIDGGLFRVLLLAVISVAGFIGYVVLAGGVDNVLSSRVARDTEAISFVAYLSLAFGVSANIYCANLLRDSNNRAPLTYVSLGFGLFLQAFCINIYNSPRFFFIASWLPIILVVARDRLSYKAVYSFILVGIFVVMPILSITSRYGIYGDENFVVNLSDSFFMIKDVDIFETLSYMACYFVEESYDYGDNLLAIIFFFIPRELWPDKPIVGGLKIGWELYFLGTATTPNLSFFIAADSYMDFGWLGVLIAGFVLGLLYHHYVASLRVIKGYEIELIVLLATLPILIRGPVGAVIGFPLCLLITARFLRIVLRMTVGMGKPGQ